MFQLDSAIWIVLSLFELEFSARRVLLLRLVGIAFWSVIIPMRWDEALSSGWFLGRCLRLSVGRSVESLPHHVSRHAYGTLSVVDWLILDEHLISVLRWWLLVSAVRRTSRTLSDGWVVAGRRGGIVLPVVLRVSLWLWRRLVGSLWRRLV